MSSNRQNSYGSILKAISLFGGVKLFQIIVGLIKNKFVAILLGPSGMGINGMLTSTTSLVKTLTGFGLEISAVRDIAKRYNSNVPETIARTSAVLNILVIFTGLLGVAVTFGIADLLSIWSFGNTDYATAFRILSITLFLDQICIGQTAVMQGTFHYKYMARSTMYGSVLGLFISIPIYYILGEKGIVPVIIISSITHLILSTYFRSKINISKIKISLKEAFIEGKSMFVIGITIALTSACTIGKTYLARMFISNEGSLTDVGLYVAGITIATQYINVVLSAMSSDYTPRLAAIAENNEEFVITINKQMRLMLYLISPLIFIFIVYIKPITILLYSSKFIPIIGMIEWMMIGMLFRSISWCISFSFVAKGDANIFLWHSLASSVYSLLLTIAGYYYLSFTGIGISFLLTYLLYTIHMYLLAHIRYDYSIPKNLMRQIFSIMIVVILLFCFMKYLGYTILRYIVGSILIICLCINLYQQLSKIIPLKQYVEKIKTILRI